MKSTTRKLTAVMLAVAAFPAATAVAQTYPSKPVRLVVPFPAGGMLDIVARTVAAPMAQSFTHNAIVDNRPGGSTIIGADLVARAPADGYTVLILGSVLTINAAVRSKLPYDTLKDFSAVARIGASPMLIAVHPSLPVKTVRDLVSLARAHPGQLTYATSGAATPMHLAMETFKGLAKADITHVPYQGGAPALVATQGGHTSMLILPVADAFPHIMAARLRAISVTSNTRSDVLKDVPTIAESGFPGFDMSFWFGAWVPAATPKVAVNRLGAEIVRVLQLPEVKGSLARLGISAAPLGPEAFDSFFRAEVQRYVKIVNETKFKLD